MSRASRRAQRANVGILLRRPFHAIVNAVDAALASAGHEAIRQAHGNVFQFVDREGTRVSVLAERAQMTKQSMAELVAHLEAHGYVERVPDPRDGRAKLVRLTARGWEVVPLALGAISTVRDQWRKRLGAATFDALVDGLIQLNRILDEEEAGAD